MTEQHPLTDKTCEDLSCCITILTTPGDPDPYIIGCPQYIADDMRAAADWQLEQVVDWVSKFGWYLFEHPCQKHEFISELKKTMRPTQEDNQ